MLYNDDMSFIIALLALLMSAVGRPRRDSRSIRVHSEKVPSLDCHKAFIFIEGDVSMSGPSYSRSLHLPHPNQRLRRTCGNVTAFLSNLFRSFGLLFVLLRLGRVGVRLGGWLALGHRRRRGVGVVCSAGSPA